MAMPESRAATKGACMITTYETRNEGNVSRSVRTWCVAGALALSSVLFLLGPGILRAQSVTAVLVGTVTDQSGASVPRAAVTVTMIGTNAKRMVLSSDNGDFTIP